MDSTSSFPVRNSEGRRAFDQYYTPDSVIRGILPYLPIRADIRILDPACGDGNILWITREWAQEKTIDPWLYGVDIDRNVSLTAETFLDQSGARGRIDTKDFLAAPYGKEVDLILMNPPYSSARQFIEQALRTAPLVAALLRIGWTSSKGRREFHKEHPSDLFVLPERPSFTGNKKTDFADYAWFVWGLPGGGGHWTVL